MVHTTMLRKSKIKHICSALLIFICATVSLLSVKGWCIDNGNESVKPHVELSACHGEIRGCDDTSPVTSGTPHTAENNECTTCYDVSADSSLVAKLFDDFFASLVSTPPINGIFLPQQHSKLKSFSTASPSDVLTIDQSSSRQNPQAIALRTIVLLI